eukprot:11675776-Heterocapsa_arctica.AAC.1
MSGGRYACESLQTGPLPRLEGENLGHSVTPGGRGSPRCFFVFDARGTCLPDSSTGGGCSSTSSNS